VSHISQREAARTMAAANSGTIPSAKTAAIAPLLRRRIVPSARPNSAKATSRTALPTSARTTPGCPIDVGA
jgi:N-acetyl-gamma-glutamylphosphate reductase